MAFDIGRRGALNWGVRCLGFVFWYGRVAQLVRALLSHSRGPGFESLRAHGTIVKRGPQWDPVRNIGSYAALRHDCPPLDILSTS